MMKMKMKITKYCSSFFSSKFSSLLLLIFDINVACAVVRSLLFSLFSLHCFRLDFVFVNFRMGVKCNEAGQPSPNRRFVPIPPLSCSNSSLASSLGLA